MRLISLLRLVRKYKRIGQIWQDEALRLRARLEAVTRQLEAVQQRGAFSMPSVAKDTKNASDLGPEDKLIFETYLAQAQQANYPRPADQAMEWLRLSKAGEYSE